MGIIKYLSDRFYGVEPEKKALRTEYFNVGNTFVPINNTGDFITLTNKQTGYENIATVYKIVRHIAQRCSEVVFEQYEKRGAKNQLEQSDFLDKLEEPNTFQTKEMFISELSSYLDLRGEFYIWKEPAAIGSEFLNLWSLPPELITRTSQESYNYKGIGNIPADQIFHSRNFVPGYRADEKAPALSPLAVAYANLKVIDFANATAQKVLSNGGVPGVAWVKQQAGEMTVTDTELKSMKDHLVKRYSNTQTYGEVSLVGQEVGFTQFGISPGDAMLLEHIEVNKEGIADALCYPLPLLHNKTGGLNSSERKDATKELLTTVVFPRLENICGILTKILNDKAYVIKFDKDEFPEMELDMASMATALQNMPFLTMNEKRLAVGYDELPDANMDVVLVPANLVSIDDVVNGGTSASDVLPNGGDYSN